QDLLPESETPIVTIVIVGNTAMAHLFSGMDMTPLAACPFEPVGEMPGSFCSQDLGWNLPGDPLVQFLPWLGGFVGSDVLAGILATGMHHSEEPCGLVDLGTNGEIVVAHRGRL